MNAQYIQFEDTKFWLAQNLPDEVRALMTILLDRHRDKVPDWCKHVHIIWDDADKDNSALGTQCQYDYRKALLWIYPNFISHPDRREENFVHELMHIYMEPWDNAVTDLKSFISEHHADAAQLVKEQLRHAMEQSICDLAGMVMTLSAKMREVEARSFYSTPSDPSLR